MVAWTFPIVSLPPYRRNPRSVAAGRGASAGPIGVISPEAGGGLEWWAAAREESIRSIHDTLVRAGVTFLADDRNGLGIRVRGKTVRLEKTKS